MSERDSRHWQVAYQDFARDVEALVADLSPERFNQSPAPDEWSVGQCLDHLNETGGRLVPRLKEALEEAPSAAGATSRLGWMDRLFVWSMEPGGWLKMPSPGAYRPAGEDIDLERARQTFAVLQEDLAACAKRAAQVDWSAVEVTSPASRFLRLSAGGWLAGTLAHQRRHFAQARRTKAVVNGRP